MLWRLYNEIQECLDGICLSFRLLSSCGGGILDDEENPSWVVMQDVNCKGDTYEASN
jgi:hypothetical protein